MKPGEYTIKDERGSAIVAALLILAVLTVIGIAAISTSTTERATSTNYLLYERVFFTAEAGLEHAKAALQNALSPQIAIVAAGGDPNFSFALTGATAPFPTSPDWALLKQFPPGIPGYKTYFGSAITNSPLDGYQYSIYIWDNRDESGPAQNPTVDADGTIYMLAQGEGPRNSRCSIFTKLEAKADFDSLSGYNAQEGAGPGKGYSSLDKAGISDFTTQVGRSGGLELH